MAHSLDEFIRERRENGDATQMAFKRALAIVLFQLRAEGLVLLQNVQYVAQHLEHDAVFRGTDGCRTRIETHAGHLAEQVARPKLGDGIVIREINRRVDRDELPQHVLAFTLVLLARNEFVTELREQAGLTAAGVHVTAWAGDENVHFALQQVKGSGPVVTFAEENVALLEAAFDDRAF